MIPPKGWRTREDSARSRFSSQQINPEVEEALAQFHAEREAKIEASEAARQSAPVSIVTVATIAATAAPAAASATTDQPSTPTSQASADGSAAKTTPKG